MVNHLVNLAQAVDVYYSNSLDSFLGPVCRGSSDRQTPPPRQSVVIPLYDITDYSMMGFPSGCTLKHTNLILAMSRYTAFCPDTP